MKGSAVRIRASAPRKARMSRLFSRLVSRLLLGLAGESLAAASGRLGAPGPAACLAARAVVQDRLGRQRLVEVEGLRRRLGGDRGGAVGAGLPDRLERRGGGHARLLQMGGAGEAGRGYTHGPGAAV